MGSTIKSCNINKSASFFGALFFAIAFASGEVSAETLSIHPVTVELGFSVTRFNYTEFSDAGATLDKELGGLPGLSLKAVRRTSLWEWEGNASYDLGSVDYTGQDSAGAPYNTITDEEVGDFSLKLGRWLDDGSTFQPYIGLGHHLWNRNIRSASLAGLFESYNWQYVLLGAKIITYRQSTSDLKLDISLIRPVNPSMYVAAYDATLHLESRNGLRLMLTAHSKLTENTTIILEPYYEYWQLGRSPSIIAGKYTVYEPASKTKNVGVNLRFGKLF